MAGKGKTANSSKNSSKRPQTKHLRPKPFKKGDPRINRDGRPPGSVSLSSRIKKRLREHPEKAEEIVDEIFKFIRNGSAKHLEILLDRTEGKVPDEKIISVQIEQRVNVLVAQFDMAAREIVGPEKAQEIMANVERHLLGSGE